MSQLINISNTGKSVLNGAGHFTIPTWFTSLLSNSTLILVIFVLVMLMLAGIKAYSIYKKHNG